MNKKKIYYQSYKNEAHLDYKEITSEEIKKIEIELAMNEVKQEIRKNE
ncbi:hypothetical protein [Clostridium sp. ZS2-4]|nr:hypothetical protein [Clostridium sp. ZS2-4]MCY6355962.1 hypothetical protein [Clostridium sp. ZS2-4]